jgi:predicted small secreted protein
MVKKLNMANVKLKLIFILQKIKLKQKNVVKIVKNVNKQLLNVQNVKKD